MSLIDEMVDSIFPRGAMIVFLVVYILSLYLRQDRHLSASSVPVQRIQNLAMVELIVDFLSNL